MRPLILIVDDSAGFRSFVRKALEPAGYSVFEMGASANVEKLVSERRPHLVLLDSTFGGTPHGPEILKRLKTNPATKSIPVVILAGSRDSNRFARWIELGAKECLPKPMESLVLIAKVRGWVRDQAPADVEGSDLSPGKVSYSTTQVLYADDEEEWRDLMVTGLRCAGYSCKTVSSGEEVLACLRAWQQLPDCLVLDYRLEDTTGVELCRGLKASPAYQKLPIIMLTAHVKQRLESLSSQAVQFILKTQRWEEILASIRSVLIQQERAAGVLQFGDLKLDPRGNAVVHRGGLVATLTDAPFKVLYYLVLRSPRAVGEREILAMALGWIRERLETEYSSSSRTVDKHINTIRSCLGQGLKNRIISIKGLGYTYLDTDVLAITPSNSGVPGGTPSRSL